MRAVDLEILKELVKPMVSAAGKRNIQNVKKYAEGAVDFCFMTTLVH